MDQRIGFCSSADGVRIAYASAGGGPARPMVRVATWLTHLEHDTDLIEPWVRDVAADRTLLRYDMRGCGLSDRDVEDFSLAAKLGDLEAVVDAADVNRFDLLGLSGGGPVAIAYAVRHPSRVAHLVLYGSYAQGRGRRVGRAPDAHEEEFVLVSLTRMGWGRPNPAFRRVFTTLFMPDASERVVRSFEHMQRVSASAETAARIREASYDTDVSALARRVTVPTLVLHLREDAATPFEEGRRLAALIPDAQFVPLEGRNHIMGSDDPAWPAFVDEVRRFTSAEEPAHRPGTRLTSRERDVLAGVADGMDNAQIAAHLSLSVRTVERHLSTIYTKLGVAGKAARAAAAAQFARHP